MNRADCFTPADRQLLLDLLQRALVQYQAHPCPKPVRYCRCIAPECDHEHTACVLWEKHLGPCKHREGLIILLEKLEFEHLPERVQRFWDRDIARRKAGERPVSQAQAADLIGCSRETLNRVLAVIRRPEGAPPPPRRKRKTSAETPAAPKVP